MKRNNEDGSRTRSKRISTEPRKKHAPSNQDTQLAGTPVSFEIKYRLEGEGRGGGEGIRDQTGP